ncbi:tripartite tricarboxylate transporter substrate binding protein [Salipiger thiooxidans]|uniref:Bug family tripartite tricarboxylate transporter substrate binding protein n=1 Tax=Salipiger thiooxidans TaxID=282683 RepID=UPI001A8F0FA3|nr:tripartite tricarboxylate transporter substrate binding protein [Salipiger thiooxidans]MBN8188090.1 tripartite tricarboxylate transporter substrate binding protein [Salipiger thiooxidans]
MKTLLTAAAMALGLAQPLLAADYPAGPVTVVVPYSPSGNTDVFMRHLAPYLEKAWGQPVLIDNRPGGGSMVGTAQVAQAKPDGQTLLVTTSAYVTAPAIQPDLPFDPREDLIPVANVGDVSYILVTNANSDFDTLDEFVAASKESPKFAATAGLGTTTHFAIEKFIADSGADVDVVHFKGGGPAVVSILSGETDIYGSSVSSAGENLTSGKVRALAVLGSERIDALPDVPSTAELGYPDLEIKQWVGMFVPAGTDPAIVEKLNADVNEALKNEEFIAKVTPLDWTLNETTPEGFAEQVDTELDMWKALAESQGLSQ